MAYEIVRTKSIVATSTLAAGQFHFVKIDANGQIVLCGDGGYAVGVVQDKPGASDPGAVCYPGDITKIMCGGTFSAGDELASDSSGHAVYAVTGDYVLGVALSAGADTKYATMIYQPKAHKIA